MQKIKVKFFDKEVYPEGLQKIGGKKSDWIDLRAREDIKLEKGIFKLIPLGVAIQLPEGYEAIIAPRSSTYKNFFVLQTNSIGVVDETYCGDNDEWKLPVLAVEETVIEKGERICQFRIVKNQPEIKFEVVDHLNEVSRGGIGSTGKT